MAVAAASKPVHDVLLAKNVSQAAALFYGRSINSECWMERHENSLSVSVAAQPTRSAIEFVHGADPESNPHQRPNGCTCRVSAARRSRGLLSGEYTKSTKTGIRVRVPGFEPGISPPQGEVLTTILHTPGEAGYRSLYLSHAKRALYHLSYIPTYHAYFNAHNTFS